MQPSLLGESQDMVLDYVLHLLQPLSVAQEVAFLYKNSVNWVVQNFSNDWQQQREKVLDNTHWLCYI